MPARRAVGGAVTAILPIRHKIQSLFGSRHDPILEQRMKTRMGTSVMPMKSWEEDSLLWQLLGPLSGNAGEGILPHSVLDLKKRG